MLNKHTNFCIGCITIIQSYNQWSKTISYPTQCSTLLHQTSTPQWHGTRRVLSISQFTEYSGESVVVDVVSGMQLLQLHSAICRHHPPQRAVLSQICCFRSVMWFCFRSCWTVLSPMMQGQPSCLLQSAGGEANRILLASALSSMRIICPNRASRRDWIIAVSLGCFVSLRTSSFRTNWYHLMPVYQKLNDMVPLSMNACCLQNTTSGGLHFPFTPALLHCWTSQASARQVHISVTNERTDNRRTVPLRKALLITLHRLCNMNTSNDITSVHIL